MKQLLYLIGQPGAGKSTLVEKLTRSRWSHAAFAPVAHIAWHTEDGIVCELGARRAKFSGTDALPLNAQPKALAFVDGAPYRWYLAEGDRLANPSFFNALLDLGVELQIVHLDVPDEVGAQRRALRAAGGKPQNPSWVRGRVTKVAGLAREFSAITTRLDGRHPPEGLVDELVAVSPLAALLRSRA